MIPTFLLNISIVGMICFGIAWTMNPLFIVGLMLLRDMPVFPPKYMVAAGAGEQEEDPDEYPEKPMGFTADVK